MGEKRINKHQFTLGHKVKDIDLIELAINDLNAKWDIDEKSLFQLNLVLEELISNTMFYGYLDKNSGKIEVDMTFDGSLIHVVISDDALAFDPTKLANDTSAENLEDREIGGLGIMLSQKISEDMIYKYQDDNNILSFKINTIKNKSSK
ncbi:MAG: ATP-binding protein [Bacteroidales bacterium]|nr:ATP-binding protein [Bacteroidales bacterium]